MLSARSRASERNKATKAEQNHQHTGKGGNTMMQPLEQFHRYAIKYQLSVTAVLLWQQVYFTMSEKGSYTKVQLSTSVLQALLQVTRSGLQGARQSLINKGLLVIEQDEQQNIAYTLKLAWIDLDILLARWEENHGKPLDETGRKAMAEPLAEPAYQMEMPDRAAKLGIDRALINESTQDQSAIGQTIDDTYGWSTTEQENDNTYGWSVTEQEHDDSYGWSTVEKMLQQVIKPTPTEKPADKAPSVRLCQLIILAVMYC